MKLDMSDERFVGLLDWSGPDLRDIERTGQATVDAPAAAAAMRATTPATLTVPGRTEQILEIWQRDYPDDIEGTISLLDRTVFNDQTGWQAASGSFADLHEGALRGNMVRRHQAVPLAARLFALTSDRKYVDVILRLMRQFVEQAPSCPDGPDPGYADWMPNYTGMDVLKASHVSENWLLALPLIHREISDQDYLMVLKGLAAMADFQYRCWHEAFCFNYCIHGIKAGAAVGLALPQFVDSDKWLQMGCRRFFGDLCRPPECLSDGCTREGLSYQSVNAYLHTKWYLLCKAHDIAVPDEFVANLERIMEFAAALVRPDGSRPQQGEASLDAPHEHYIVSHELLHVGAAIFDRADLRAAAGNIRGDRLSPIWLWVIDPEFYHRWRGMGRPSLQKRRLPSRRLGDSKYFILRHGAGLDAVYAMMTATDAINHGHHDALHVELYALGRSLLGDTGHGGYGRSVRRNHLRPQLHNTICISPLDPTGPNRWPQELTRQVAWLDDDDLVLTAVEHELYAGFLMRRVLVLIKPLGVLVVYDQVRATTCIPTDMTIETYFHFAAPQSQLGLDGNGRCWSQHQPHRSVWLYPTSDLDAPPERRRGPFDFGDVCRQLEMADGDANVMVTPLGPDGVMLHERPGWWCLSGGAVKRPVARYRFAGTLPFQQAYLLVPFRGTDPPLGDVSGCADAAGVVVATISGRRFQLDMGELVREQPSGEPNVSLHIA